MAGFLIAIGGVLTACSSAPATPPSVGAAPAVLTVPAIPLTSSSTGPTFTWATMALGHLDDPLNTFWELFALPGGSARWELSTPPGVASNGGVVASAVGSTVLAGFEPSHGLLFSPLAQSADQGTTWSAGVLAHGLAPVPDSLATTGSGPAVALLRTADGTVVTTDQDLSAWTTMVTARGLAGLPAAATCSVRQLTAVEVGADPRSALVGAICARGGRTGLFERSGDGWTSVGPALPGISKGPTETVRLVATSAGITALVAAGSGVATSLYALWSGDGSSTWAVSTALPVTGSTLISTGVTAEGGLVVAASRTNGGHGPAEWAATIGPSTTRWQTLRPPPPGTSAVVATPTGSFDALLGHDSTLTVDSLGAEGWTRTQTLGVPIQYGSSGGGS
jgi:hypothetical protein